MVSSSCWSEVPSFEQLRAFLLVLHYQTHPIGLKVQSQWWYENQMSDIFSQDIRVIE